MEMRERRSPLPAEKAHHSFHTCLIYFFGLWLQHLRAYNNDTGNDIDNNNNNDNIESEEK